MDELVNKTLGQYQIRREIGRGGMAIVYEAYQPALRRTVAIKVLPPNLSHDPEFVRRFQQEAIAAANLRHANIVTIYDVGSQGPYNFIVMEYLEGHPLSNLVRIRGPLPVERVVKIVEQVAEALDYAHKHGFVHRDIKPSNIMMGPDDHATLTDFGIARALSGTRLTQTGALIGTPEYMAPEQVRGSHVDHRADIYALGIVAYEMLTGVAPFSGDTAAVLYKQVHEPPPRLDALGSPVPPHIVAAVRHALAKDPDQRLQSAGEFAAALSGKRPAAAPVPAPSPPRPHPAPPPTGDLPPTVRLTRGWPAWLPWLLGIAGVLLMCIAITSVITIGGLWPAPTPPQAQPQVANTPSPIVLVVTTTPNEQVVLPTDTPTPSPTPTPTGLQWGSIGQSVQGRDLSMATIGSEGNTVVVVIGSIQGDQPNTRDLTNALISHFEQTPHQVPEGVAFHFLPSLDPDGNASNSRYNANGVDLNRNWGTKDWRSDPAVPEQPGGKAGAGGERPFSEPETRSLRDFLLRLQPQVSDLRVVVLHSSTRRSKGEVYPGGDNAIDFAQTYAMSAGYDIEMAWAEYTTSGELVTWCTEQGLLSIDIVIPGSQRPSTQVPGTNHTLLEITVQALQEIASHR